MLFVASFRDPSPSLLGAVGGVKDANLAVFLCITTGSTSDGQMESLPGF
jgi:hypothetical protein